MRRNCMYQSGLIFQENKEIVNIAFPCNETMYKYACTDIVKSTF